MDLSHAILPDDLVLARLSAAKLGRVMHGLLSVGTASLELPEPAGFLGGRDATPLAFLEVLRCVGVRMEHPEAARLLRDHVDRLAEIICRFHRSLLDLAGWRAGSPRAVRENVERTVAAYSEFCRGLDEYCALLGVESGHAERAKEALDGLVGYFQQALME